MRTHNYFVKAHKKEGEQHVTAHLGCGLGEILAPQWRPQRELVQAQHVYSRLPRKARGWIENTSECESAISLLLLLIVNTFSCFSVCLIVVVQNQQRKYFTTKIYPSTVTGGGGQQCCAVVLAYSVLLCKARTFFGRIIIHRAYRKLYHM